MINEVILVGSIADVKGYITFNQRPFLHIQLCIEKSYQEIDGCFKYEKIDCLVWKGEAKRVEGMLKEKPWLSIKGRLEKNRNGKMMVVAEKLKFLYW